MTKKDLKKSAEMTPAVFKQIKNRFFGNAEFNSFRAPVPPGTGKPYVDEMSHPENIWDEIGEKAKEDYKNLTELIKNIFTST